ncbi:hypothetical protein ASPWEDRAFT_70912 [Aspergillus wentii DTO 134E9]|uniref:Uncharacterized protein n=1 Tax=Aspergillus wentii DTO 134E9 TaxID=1073089 RepID=A0A1L9RES1_ASPWE|nr:uncharacterized protein ASPWEDRAFT_70912 [Aspergillus wentii DTO 134E9]OJJ33367.1 hypothetical protein ASPWEDRAFT_70912 [Aspergillus wentii DTO 134E9]
MRYVWEGCCLPTTRKEYMDRFGITELAPSSDTDKTLLGGISSELNNILKTYADIQDTTTTFRDKTWPSIVDLAGRVQKYAETLSDDKSASYYTNIINLTKNYTEAKDATKKSVLKAEILGLIDATIQNINTYSEGIPDVIKKLGNFQEDTKSQSEKIKTDHERLKGYQKEYTHDVVVAATTPTYAWVTILGLIAAVVVAAVVGHRAVEMKDTILDLTNTIKSENDELKAAHTVQIDITRMDTSQGNLKDLIKVTKAALNVLELLEGVWTEIKTELKGIQDLLKDDSEHEIKTIIVQIDVNQVFDEWGKVRDYTKKYIEHAFVSPPQIQSIVKYLKKLDETIKNTKGDGDKDSSGS